MSSDLTSSLNFGQVRHILPIPSLHYFFASDLTSRLNIGQVTDIRNTMHKSPPCIAQVGSKMITTTLEHELTWKAFTCMEKGYIEYSTDRFMYWCYCCRGQFTCMVLIIIKKNWLTASPQNFWKKFLSNPKGLYWWIVLHLCVFVMINVSNLYINWCSINYQLLPFIFIGFSQGTMRFKTDGISPE